MKPTVNENLEKRTHMKMKKALEGRFGASESFLLAFFFAFVSALRFFTILQQYTKHRYQMWHRAHRKHRREDTNQKTRLKHRKDLSVWNTNSKRLNKTILRSSQAENESRLVSVLWRQSCENFRIKSEKTTSSRKRKEIGGNKHRA